MVLIFSGIVIYIVDLNLVVVVLLCFGLGYCYGIVLGNGIGLIDVDYQGLLLISVWNWGCEFFILQLGDCIVQLVVLLIVCVGLQVVDIFSDSVRGMGGFGYIGVC